MWRTAYGIGMIPILYMLYYRIFRLRESAVWKKRKTGESRNMGLLFKHYWSVMFLKLDRHGASGL